MNIWIAQKEGRENRLVIRFCPWRQTIMVLMLVVFTALMTWGWVVNTYSDRTLGFGGTIILGYSIYLFEVVWDRIIVTADRVRVVSIHRDPPVLRGQVRDIRALRWNTVFYDHDRKRILQTRADLSRAQLVALGEELGVPVWDHRAWWGLRELEHGVRLSAGDIPSRRRLLAGRRRRP